MQGIFKQSIIIVAAAVLIISAYFIIGILVFANNQYYEINLRNLEEVAKTLKNFTPDDVFTDPDAARDWASKIMNTKAAFRITLIGRNGQVIFDTDADSSIMENHLDRAEFQAAVRGGIGTSRRESETLGKYHLYTAIAINNSSGELSGILRLSNFVPGFFSRLLGSTLLFMILGLIIILCACGGIFYFSRCLSISVEASLEAELKKKTAELIAKAKEAESENRYREFILDSMFDGLLSLNGNLEIIYANTRLCSLFGVDREKAPGMTLLEFSHSAELTEAARLVMSTGSTNELTLKRFLGGARQYFHVFAAAFEGGVVMVIGDISRLVKLEQIRKDFAANVSHELRTPIQVIKGFSENLLDSPLDNKDEIRLFAGLISKNVLNMENITNDLLTLVSLENEEITRPEMEETLLYPLISLAINAVENAARKKSISINVICPEDISAKLHESLIMQALINLLDNGIKYSGEGSSIQIVAYYESKKIVFEVKDNGIGIPVEHIDRIFERFYRVDRSRPRTLGSLETGDTGLGLSIVRHIAILHNGTVEAESHVGEGSVFKLILPR